MRLSTVIVLAAVLTLVAAPPAAANILVGATAPDFSKQELVGSSLGPAHTLYQHSDRAAVVLFLLGHA